MTLKDLLSPELYAQVQARIDEENAKQSDKAKHIKFADLSEGGYVSTDKYLAQINALNQQITDLQGQITKRDGDITGLQQKLSAAQADATKLTDAQNALTALQTQYNTDRQDWEKKTQKQKYEFIVREKANGLSFTSPAAKRDFISQANGKEFKVDGETLLGYEDFLTKYKADNPGAFVEATPKEGDPSPDGGKSPTIVLPKSGNPTPDKNAFGFHFSGVRPKPAAEN